MLEPFLLDEFSFDQPVVSIVNIHTSLFALYLMLIESAKTKKDKALFTSVYQALKDYTINYSTLEDLEFDQYYPLKTDYGSLKVYAQLLKKQLNRIDKGE